MEALLDECASSEGCSIDPYNDIRSAYSTAMRLEIAFFQGVPFKSTYTGLSVATLCVDFDDTITGVRSLTSCDEI
jgi:hypothetical protein